MKSALQNLSNGKIFVGVGSFFVGMGSVGHHVSGHIAEDIGPLILTRWRQPWLSLIEFGLELPRKPRPYGEADCLAPVLRPPKLGECLYYQDE